MSNLALPEGWKREEVKRSNGLSAGKIEVYYISPSGKKIKSKSELAQYFGNAIDLTTFDFRTGKINSSLIRKAKNRRYGLHDYSSLKIDQSLVLPVRQTPSILKIPVKVISTQPNSTVFNCQQIKDYYKKANMTNLIEAKSDSCEKPYQVFWQKRLQGLKASEKYLDEMDNFDLPPNIKAFIESLADKDTLLRSITASLHLNHAVRGQDKHVLQKKKEPTENGPSSPRNPVAFVNPNQPLIISTTVTDEDIRRQEELVQEARQKLISAVKDLYYV